MLENLPGTLDVSPTKLPLGDALPVLAGEMLNWFASWPDGLVAVDHTHRIAHLSPKAQEFLGWSADHALGRGVHELLCARSRDYAHNPDDCPLCTDDMDSDQTYSTWWLTREGRNISVDYRIIPVQSGSAARLISFYDNRARAYSFREMVKYTEYVDLSPTPIAEFDSEGQLLETVARDANGPAGGSGGVVRGGSRVVRELMQSTATDVPEEHLLDGGHSRIAFVGGPDTIGQVRDRLAGEDAESLGGRA